MLLWLIGAVLVPAVPLHGDENIVNSTHVSQSRFSTSVDVGLLFIDGNWVSRPYLVEATDQVVTVNGIKCFEVKNAPPGDSRRRHSGGWPQQTRSDNEDWHRGWQGHLTVRSAENIVNTLSSEGIVVLEEGVGPRFLFSGDDVYAFCNAMLSEHPTADQISAFEGLGGRQPRGMPWRNWLETFEPNATLRALLQRELDAISRQESLETAHVAAMRRLDTMTYPLTLAGMLLGVVALGHMLKWTARTAIAEHAGGESPEVIRCVEIALLLMLLMSAIDLVWTILAGQAGVMREVNPVASGWIQTPLKLVLFKVTATGLGCCILFAWRRRSQVQNATWWMCLVCVLLTFRWVVFDSVMN